MRFVVEWLRAVTAAEEWPWLVLLVSVVRAEWMVPLLASVPVCGILWHHLELENVRTAVLADSK